MEESHHSFTPSSESLPQNDRSSPNPKAGEKGSLYFSATLSVSFSFHICKEIAERLPGFTVQYLGRGKTPEEVKAAGINGIDYNYHRLKMHRKWVKRAHENGMSTNAWTFDRKGGMKKMLKMGLNSLTTDNPLEARELMKEMGIEENQ